MCEPPQRSQGKRHSSISTQSRLGVKAIQCTDQAFAGIRTDGTVVTWGSRNFGGSCSDVEEQLREVKAVQATRAAFAAVRADGSVITWPSGKALGQRDLAESICSYWLFCSLFVPRYLHDYLEVVWKKV